MKKQNISPKLRRFLIRIIATNIGLVLIAAIIALSLNIHFGVILFMFGVLVTIAGSYLGGPNRYDIKSYQIRDINLFNQPAPKELTARMMHFVKNSVPFYSFEDVLLFVGLISTTISLLFFF